MLHFNIFQQQQSWHFDLTSAIIGAAIALLIARVAYVERERIKALGVRLWAPVVDLRRRLRASREEKYITALQEKLRDDLLFKPKDPRAIFCPPTFAAPPQLPVSLSQEQTETAPAHLAVPFSDLLDGYPRLVITGKQTSGRTTTLAMTVWHTAQQATKRRPYARFPVWIDLAQLKTLPVTEEMTPVEHIVQLAKHFMPGAADKWISAHLQNEPSLILVDNWETLTAEERAAVLPWLTAAAASLPKSFWLVACGQNGYGPFVENGFVPIELIPPTGEAVITRLYHGWAELLGKGDQPLPEEARNVLVWATQAGASLLELNARTFLYVQTQQLPINPIEMMDRLLDDAIPVPDLGEGQEEVAEQARFIALNTLSYLAKQHKLNKQPLTQEAIVDFMVSLLPPQENRPPKLESATRRILTNSRLLQQQDGKFWTLTHYLWDDFLTAWALLEDEDGSRLAQAHLNDDTWTLLLEFYAGLADVSALVHVLLNRAMTRNDHENLLQVARWGVVAPETANWRKTLMKALAQRFTDTELPQALRLRIGRALVIAAGEGSRAFFLQTLRHVSAAIRSAGLRGIGWSGSPREMPLLVGALRDPDLTIRQSAVEALADFGTSGAIRTLHDAMYEADEHLLPTIAGALARSAEGQEILKDAAENEALLIRRTAAQGLSQVEHPWAKTLLEKLAREDSEWLVRSAAEIGLSTMQEESETKTVVLAPPRIDQIEWLIAWAAEQGQGLGIGKAAMAMLEKAVVDGDARAKILGTRTLTQVGQLSHLKLLEPLCEDADPEVRRVAGEAVRQIEQRYHFPDTVEDSGVVIG